MKRAGDDVQDLMVDLGLRSRTIHAAAGMDEGDALVFDELIARERDGVIDTEERGYLNRAREAIAQGRAVTFHGLRARAAPPRPNTDLEDNMVAWGIPMLYVYPPPGSHHRPLGQYVREELSPRQTLAVQAVSRWRTLILVMFGERGCGKSFAAALWLASFSMRPPPPLRNKITPRRFIEMDQLPDEPREDRAELAYAIGLVIDDAGTERDTWIDAVATLIARRHRHALPTIITTNLNRKDFELRYGQRVSDRLRESGQFELTGDVGSSLRGRGPR